MPMAQPTTLTSIIGPWKGEAPTTLLQRCRDAWDTPFKELSDLMVATFLNQRIAVPQMLAEARRRLDTEPRDDTEYFDGQLLEAVIGADN
ncbi:contact-dependent growth inhibition system immunity protein [Pseudomonas donghuensis]|uniref:contact-dependent growth inhibition system immunity protein n=2 Tax=Pseudomonas donghuensis TaxID=1163398 RepID=UPI0037C9D6FC